MREILFRGKYVGNGRWVQGHLLTRKDKAYICPELTSWYVFDGDLCLGGYIEVDPTTVGQYTGLCDKNGKKIFEGDIVICKQPINGNHISWHIEKGFVEMKHGAFGLHREKGYYRPFKDWLEDYLYEVIGNIHDNPELLEVANG